MVPALDRPFNLLITGIGGTGVVTIGALLGMAAHLEGKGCSVLDQSGASPRRAAAVISHVKIAPRPADLNAVRVAAGGAHLVLGCDLVVTSGAEARSTVKARHHPDRRQRSRDHHRGLHPRPRLALPGRGR